MLKNGSIGVIVPWDESFPGSRSLQRKYHDSPKIPAVALDPTHSSGSMREELQGAQGRISVQASFLQSAVPLHHAFSYPWLLCCGN